MKFNELKSQLDTLNLSGVCSVHMGNDLVFAEAYGYSNITYEARNNVNTSFAAASFSKGFTAVSILQLIEQGKIDYSIKVTEIMKGSFPYMSDEVAIAHLLSHTSGFEDYMDEEKAMSYEELWNHTPQHLLVEPKAFIPLMNKNKMEFAPGSRFKYNNGAFVILARIVEIISGIPFTEYVASNILIPCGMKNSGYFRMENLPLNTATGYTIGKDRVLKSNIYSVPLIGGGDGGIYINVNDLNKFWLALSSYELLTENTIKYVWSPHAFNEKNGNYYGLGFWVSNSESEIKKVFLTGGDPGVSCRSCFYPKSKACISVLLNADKGSAKAFKLIEDHLLKETVIF